MIKITLLGGSALASPLLIESFLKHSPKQSYEFVFQGRSLDKLKAVLKLSKGFHSLYPETDISMRMSTDPIDALEGADFVINQIRVGGLKGRLHDESFPPTLGIPGEESVGPGSFLNAVRSFPPALSYARTCEKYCPNCTWINLTNPSSMVQYALEKFTTLKVIGICDMPEGLLIDLGNHLGIDWKELEYDWGGMNHLGWLCGLRHDGKDLFPHLMEELELIKGLTVEPDLIRAIGAIPANYLKYYLHPEKHLFTGKKRHRAEELMDINNDMLETMQVWQPGDPLAFLQARNANWYDWIVAPLLYLLAEKESGELILSVPNEGSYPTLPHDAIIEVPAQIKNGEIIALRPASLPPLALSLLERVSAYERQASEAIVLGNKKLALQALLMNPMIHSYAQTKAVLENAWQQDKDIH
ncbi:MAG: hypothetical protein ACOYKC_01575 [Anaerolineaceae bacterium]|jgi:6-phospho-beta-glucosidase